MSACQPACLSVQPGGLPLSNVLEHPMRVPFAGALLAQEPQHQEQPLVPGHRPQQKLRVPLQRQVLKRARFILDLPKWSAMTTGHVLSRKRSERLAV